MVIRSGIPVRANLSPRVCEGTPQACTLLQRGTIQATLFPLPLPMLTIQYTASSHLRLPFPPAPEFGPFPRLWYTEQRATEPAPPFTEQPAHERAELGQPYNVYRRQP